VNQYQPEQTPIARTDPTYQESGYRHNHVAIRAGGGEDHLHVVQTWGQGESIRPYGEWEYPFRAGATPFGPWGNPQGPWTLPFDSWQNPYGLGQLPYLSSPYGPSMHNPGMGGPTTQSYGGPAASGFSPMSPGWSQRHNGGHQDGSSAAWL
jgi:hypothetical protein